MPLKWIHPVSNHKTGVTVESLIFVKHLNATPVTNHGTCHADVTEAAAGGLG